MCARKIFSLELYPLEELYKNSELPCQQRWLLSQETPHFAKNLMLLLLTFLQNPCTPTIYNFVEGTKYYTTENLEDLGIDDSNITIIAYKECVTVWKWFQCPAHVDLKADTTSRFRLYENYKPWIQKSSTTFGKFNKNGKPRMCRQSTVRQGLLHLTSPSNILFCRHSAWQFLFLLL